ncbi:MAG: hypothetical protein HDT21_11910 [Ruminococcus sp.]|nr:hypothetical protein [Ruminococcus sp.]
MNDMRLRARGRNFALCGARPKGSALWTSASWAQLDQLMSAASPPVFARTSLFFPYLCRC